MTNKEIIIDGVDVRECAYFRDDVYADKQIDNACSIGLWQRYYSRLEENCKMHCECKNNPNCYFKQLKRKEQECEHWKNQCLCLDDESITVQISQEQFEDYCRYKQTLDGIEDLILKEPISLSKVEETLIRILVIINKAKDGE